MMLWRAAELMATTFCMTSSPTAACAALRCSKLLTSPRFGTSARKGENGFVRQENCFVAGGSTKHSGQKCEYSQYAENSQISVPEKFRFRRPYSIFAAHQRLLLSTSLGSIGTMLEVAAAAPHRADQALSPTGENR